MPLIAADLTRRTGYLNLAIGALGLAAGLGATASTTAAGWVADMFGAPAAFLGLALVGFGAVATAWRGMPETRPGRPLTGRPAVGRPEPLADTTASGPDGTYRMEDTRCLKRRT